MTTGNITQHNDTVLVKSFERSEGKRGVGKARMKKKGEKRKVKNVG